jgi:hypothetical protein
MKSALDHADILALALDDGKIVGVARTSSSN